MDILKFWTKIAGKTNVFYSPPGKRIADLKYEPGKTTYISLLGVDVGLGNLKAQYGQSKWLEKIYGSRDDIAIVAEFGEVTGFEKGLVESRLRNPLEGHTRNPTDDYCSLEGYLKERGIAFGIKSLIRPFALWGIYKTLLGKFRELEKNNANLIILSSQETALEYLKAEGIKAHTGVAVSDTIEKPGLNALKPMDFIFRSPYFIGTTGAYSGKVDGYTEGITGAAMLESLVAEKRPLQTAVFLPPEYSEKRGTAFEVRNKEISDLVENYGAAGRRAIKISIIPSGSGMADADVEKIIKDLAPYINSGQYEITWLATTSALLENIKSAAAANKVDLDISHTKDNPADYSSKKIKVIYNENKSPDDKISLIERSYQQMQNSHLCITLPGEQPMYAGTLGVYSLLGAPKGWNEVQNAENFEKLGIAQSFKADQSYGKFISDLVEKGLILKYMDKFRDAGCGTPYELPGFALKAIFEPMLNAGR